MTISLNLRLAVASHYNEEARSRWLASSDIEWETLAQEAIVNRLAPLLYDSLQKFPRHDVPNTILESLQTVYYATAARNAQMHEQLKKVTDALDEIGVRYILLKGAALIQDVYDGNMALRPMSDIDLLVDTNDFRCVADHLKNIIPFGPSKLDHKIITHHLKLLPSNDVCVELHSRIIGLEFYVDRPAFEIMWAAKQNRSGLSPEQQFVHLCGHNLLHHNKSVPHFGADAAFVSQQISDWEIVIQFARENDLLLPLKYGVETISDLWYVNIPDKVLQKLLQTTVTPREKYFNFCLHWKPLRLFTRWLYVSSLSLKAQYAWSLIFPKYEYN